MTHAETIIIGGGPAGMTTAIQLKRYGLDPLLFESRRLGGLLWNANLVENYPGFPDGIPGPALVERLSQQFTNLDIRHLFETITQVDHDGEVFMVSGQNGEHTTNTLVLATGTQPITFPASLIPDDAASRVFYEVHDLAEMHHARIAIIGAGDAAFDYALNLASRENEVTIFNRGTEIRALPLLVGRVKQNQHISYRESTALEEVWTEHENLLIRVVDGSGKTSYKVDALLGAIGRSPSGPVCTHRLIVSQDHLQESGALHLIGDLQNGIYRQAVIAVGDGLKAAMKIYQFLREEEEL